MANVFIVLASIVLTTLCFAAIGYLVILYCHPEEKEMNSGIVYKVFIVLGFTGGIVQIAMIPLDVENIRSDYGLSMYSAWTIILLINVILMVLIVPFLLFFYETDTDANVVDIL